VAISVIGGENYRPVATLSDNVYRVRLTMSGIWTHNLLMYVWLWCQ